MAVVLDEKTKKIFEELKLKIDIELKSFKKKKVLVKECCICYNKTKYFKIKLDCNHEVCLSCILQMQKDECPICRTEFPYEISCLLHRNKQNTLSHPDNWFSWNGTPLRVSGYTNNNDINANIL